MLYRSIKFCCTVANPYAPQLQVSNAALSLFNFGQQQAAQRGLLLVDTKYEFGKDADGQIRLIDEVVGSSYATIC